MVDNVFSYKETILWIIEEAKAGKTIKCSSFEEYLKVVQ